MFTFGNTHADHYKLFKYMGSKDKHLDLINSLIQTSSKTKYVEPFLGSGAVFLNLKKNFSKYIINDSCKDLLSFYIYKDELTPDFILSTVKELDDQYNVLTKDGYYKLRDDVLNKEPESAKRAVCFWLVASLCMNGMLRYNTKGDFNQSQGGYGFDTPRFINTMKKIKSFQNLDFYSESFESILDTLPDSDHIIFIDPPYVADKMALSDGFNSESLTKLIDFMENTNNDIIYTDTSNEFNTNLKGFCKIKISDMRGTRPRVGRQKPEEFLFYKIH